MKKRIISFILVMVMVLGMLPVSFAAAEPAAQAEERADTIKIDFQALGAELAQQSWWKKTAKPAPSIW